MSDQDLNLIQKRVRSPRSAALAGILFAALMVTSMLLVMGVAQVDPGDISLEWLESKVRSVSTALGLVPFAGIAFFWFTGVIRDHIGEREDRFFATVFLGSGIAFVVLMFVWAATIGAVFGSYAFAGSRLSSIDVYIYGFLFMNEIMGNFILRIAGVYMISIGTIWTRAEVMPRWLTIITYLVAVVFLFFANAIHVTRFLFPGWVFLASVYILITNRRLEREK